MVASDSLVRCGHDESSTGFWLPQSLKHESNEVVDVMKLFRSHLGLFVSSNAVRSFPQISLCPTERFV